MGTTNRYRQHLLIAVAAVAALVTGISVACRPSAGAEAKTEVVSEAPLDLKSDWIVSAKAAHVLIKQGALVLDARASDLKDDQGALANAAPVVWQDLSEPDLPTKGLLLRDTNQLNQRLHALGVSTDRPIVVVGDPVNGWGDDGRVAWALRTFGHKNVVIVDGGLAAIQKIGPLSIKPPKVPGDFQATIDPRWVITKEELREHLKKKDLALLDVREPREYAGETPYGESRGGHIPGAKSLWFKNLLAKDGKLYPRSELERLLASKGVKKDSSIVAYCTGGIRSGWTTVVLNALGYSARNYVGSGWDWAAAPAAEYPLVKSE